MRRIRVLAIIVGVHVAFPGAAQAQPAPEPGRAEPAEMPTPAQILDRYFDVTGGREAYAKIRNRKISGSMEQDGTVYGLTIYEEAPGRRYAALSTPTGGGTRFVTNEEEDWTYEGEVIVRSEGEHRRQAIQRAVFDPLLRYDELWAMHKTLGIEHVKGRPTYRVRFMDEECHKTYHHFDTETGRLVRTAGSIDYRGSPINVVADMGEFEVIDGVLMPTRMERVLLIQGRRMVQRYELDLIEHNVEMPDGIFDTPPELRPGPDG